MSEVPTPTIWLEVDVANPAVGEVPRFLRGSAVEIKIAFFDNGQLLDVSNLSSVDFKVFSLDDLAGDAVMADTVSSLNSSLTAAQWIARSAAHLTVSFTGAETTLALGGMEQREFRFSVIATTTGAATIIHNIGELIVVESGIEGDAPTVLGEFVRREPTDGNYRVKEGKTFQLLNSTDNLYHSVWLETENGSPVLKWAETGES